jgi:phosphoglycolate phosphatase
MKKYKAILFDLDGTLLDTLNDIGNAANRVLAKHQFPVHPVDAYRYFVGDGVKTLFARALPADKQNDSIIQTCMKDFEHEYSRNWNNETSLYPGIQEMLDLMQARGLKMAILSNKPQEFTQYCVEGFLYNWNFEAVNGFQASIPPKPHPAGALAIARQMGIAPASFIYLGDTGTDMQTASAAGMYPVGALWGFRSSDELTENGAKVVVNNPLEVAELYGKITC